MKSKQLTLKEFKEIMTQNTIIKVGCSPEYVNAEDDYKPTEIIFYLDNKIKIEITHLEHYISIWKYED